MSGWLSRSPRRQSSSLARLVRPRLEELERRDCPTAPTLSNLTIVNTTGHMFQISGSVQDAHPSTVVVNFSSALSGSVHASSDGSFLFETEASDLGLFWAVATDQDHLTSNVQYGELTSAAPTIANFVARHNQDGTWTLSGQVQDESPETTTVTLGGLDAVANFSVEVGSDGTFTATVDLAGGDPSLITATATDCWGLTGESAIPEVPVAPEITDMAFVNVGNHMYMVTGTVTGTNLSGISVTFDGVLSGSATVNEDGSFTFMGQATNLGNFTAVAVDDQYLASTPVLGEITNNAPAIINFTMVRGSGNSWTVSGTVVDESPTSTTVVLGNIEILHGATLQPDTDGTFSWSFDMVYYGGGTISAQATDCWGETSTVVYQAF